jgi:hypothetical protein
MELPDPVVEDWQAIQRNLEYILKMLRELEARIVALEP